jgi:hypothetical protein
MPYLVHEHSQYTSRIDKYWYFLKLESAHEFYATMLAYREVEHPQTNWSKKYFVTHFNDEDEENEFLELDIFSFEDVESVENEGEAEEAKKRRGAKAREGKARKKFKINPSGK